MKRKSLITVLIIEAVILVAAVLFINEYPGYFKDNSFPFDLIGDYFFAVREGGSFLNGIITVIAFPFEQIGYLLRMLSSVGTIGNALSASLIVLFTCIPLIPLLKHYKDKSRKLENFILLLLCPVTATVIYFMTDSAAILSLSHVVNEDSADIMRCVLACTLWSGILSYFTAVIIRTFTSYDQNKIIKCTQYISYILCGFFVFIICTVCLPHYLYELSDGILTGTEKFYSRFSFFLSLLTYLFDITVLLSACELINAFMKSKPLTVLSVKSSDLAKKSSWALIIVTAGCFIKNILQIVCINELNNIHTVLNIPLFNLGFLLVTLLLSRLIIENKRLKEDNDMFI